nr:hypothetical protein [uncultured Schaedlerella sp.]
MLELIQMIQQTGLSAKYALFGSLFSSLKAVIALKNECNLGTIAIEKKSSRTKYRYQGSCFHIKEIYSMNHKRCLIAIL